MKAPEQEVEATRWQVRGRLAGIGPIRVDARRHTFDVGAQVGLHDDDPRASALEYLLGALLADVLRGFERQLAREGVRLFDLEGKLDGRLDNPLVHLGVRGESGHAGLAEVRGTVYVSAEGEPQRLSALWHQALAEAPVFQTLSRAAQVQLRLQPID